MLPAPARAVMQPSRRRPGRALRIAGVALLLYLILALIVAQAPGLEADLVVLRWLGSRGDPRLDSIALDFTAFGSGYALAVIAGVVAAILGGRRHSQHALHLWVALAGGWLLGSTLKRLAGRPRPDVFEWVAPYAGSSSFPSGHSLNAMVAYSTLAYLLLRLGPRTLRWWHVVVPMSIVIALVGLSRVYLGVHYPTDVLGGFLIGAAWAALCASAAEAVERRRATGGPGAPPRDSRGI